MHILFAGVDYEECGGAYDIFFTGELEECRKKVPDAVERLGKLGDDVWWHIYSILSNQIVEESE